MVFAVRTDDMYIINHPTKIIHAKRSCDVNRRVNRPSSSYHNYCYIGIPRCRPIGALLAYWSQRQSPSWKDCVHIACNVCVNWYLYSNITYTSEVHIMDPRPCLVLGQGQRHAAPYQYPSLPSIEKTLDKVAKWWVKIGSLKNPKWLVYVVCCPESYLNAATNRDVMTRK